MKNRFSNVELKAEQQVDVPVGSIRTGNNDRTSFDTETLKDLATSIDEHGLAQRPLIRPIKSKEYKYEIVAGERRFRAMSQVLGWTEIPVVVRKMNDMAASALMLAENLARQDIDPIDEANAYARRINEGWTIWEIADRCGIRKERVEGRLKLNKVREEIQDLVRFGNFPIGHAEVLSKLDNNRQMLAAKPLIGGQHLTKKAFIPIVEELYEQQCQESMFDGDVFGTLSEILPPPTPKPARFPVALDLPTPNTKGTQTVGEIAFWYISELKDQGYEREAETIGRLLFALQEANYVRVPMTTELANRFEQESLTLIAQAG